MWNSPLLMTKYHRRTSNIHPHQHHPSFIAHRCQHHQQHHHLHQPQRLHSVESVFVEIIKWTLCFKFNELFNHNINNTNTIAIVHHPLSAASSSPATAAASAPPSSSTSATQKLQLQSSTTAQIYITKPKIASKEEASDDGRGGEREV